jgi:hypothetical protein
MTQIRKTPLGYMQFTVAGTAKFVNAQTMTSPSGGTGAPSGAEFALIIAETNAIRYMDHGGTPTSGTGLPVATGGALEYDGSMANFATIAQSGTATVNITFYGSGAFNA